MSCGGGMMRTGFQPLAHLVDAAAEKWLAAEQGSAAELARVTEELVCAFRIGQQPSLTFHGLRYQLTISRAAGDDATDALHIHVHEIAQNA